MEEHNHSSSDTNELTAMEKEATTEKKERSPFEIMFDLVERWKSLAVLGGMIYIIGYIVTAAHLAQYGVSITTLIDAQYFAAGIMPGFLLLLTAFVVISALRFDSQKNNRIWLLARILTGILIAIFIILVFSLGDRFNEIWTNFGDHPAGMPFVFLFGELCLWILIVSLHGFKKEITVIFLLIKNGKSDDEIRRWFNDRIKRWNLEKFILLLMYSSLLMIFAIFALISIPLSSIEIYEQIPQAYGGGKPLTVQLYVDSHKIPAELLDTNVTSAQDSPTRTVPLNLIFKTSTEYIVSPIGDSDRRAWVLKGDAVYAMISV